MRSSRLATSTDTVTCNFQTGPFVGVKTPNSSLSLPGSYGKKPGDVNTGVSLFSPTSWSTLLIIMRRPPPPSTLQKTTGRPFSSPCRTILSLGDGVPDCPREKTAQRTAPDTTNEAVTKITLRFVHTPLPDWDPAVSRMQWNRKRGIRYGGLVKFMV